MKSSSATAIGEPPGGVDRAGFGRHDRAGCTNSSPPSRATHVGLSGPRAAACRATWISAASPAFMAEAVVEHLQAVEIDEQHRAGSCRSARGAAIIVVELAHQPAAVGERRPADRDAASAVELADLLLEPRDIGLAAARSPRASRAGSRRSWPTSMHLTIPTVRAINKRKMPQMWIPNSRPSRIAPLRDTPLGPPLLRRQQRRHDGRSARRHHHGQHVRLGDDAARRRDARRARRGV